MKKIIAVIMICALCMMVSHSIKHDEVCTTAYVTGVDTFITWTRYGPVEHKVVYIQDINGDSYSIYNNTLYAYCKESTNDELNIRCDVATFNGMPIHGLSRCYVEPDWLQGVSIEVMGIY